jgi:hypothetical protein
MVTIVSVSDGTPFAATIIPQRVVKRSRERMPGLVRAT